MNREKSGVFGAIVSLCGSYWKNSPRIIAFAFLSLLPLLPFFIPAAVSIILTETASSYYLYTHSTLIDILNAVTPILFILAFLLSRPLALGRIYCNLMVFTNKKPRVSDVFSRMGCFKKSIVLQLLLLEKAIICFLPLIAFLFALGVLNYIDLPYNVSNLIYGKSKASQYIQLGGLVLGIAFFAKGLKSYSPLILAKPLMALDPKLTPKECIETSKALSNVNSGYAGHMFTCGIVSIFSFIMINLVILIPLGQIVGESNINTLMTVWAFIFYFVAWSMLCHFNAMYCIQWMSRKADTPQQ